MKIDGYVIVRPVNPWDEDKKDFIIPRMAYSTFGLTPTEAWARHIGSNHATDPDFSIKVQRWHDNGYRLKRATLEIQYEEQPEL